jgi:uncharacterized membrane protein YeaQ/YmgE (transglycosylase-associated protein family)
MIGALLLGLVAGVIGRLLVPDMWSGLSGPKSWLFSLVLGLAGAVVGYLIFTDWLGIGDTDVFDWGGILGAIIGVVILLPFVGIVVRLTRTASRRRSIDRRARARAARADPRVAYPLIPADRPPAMLSTWPET